MKISHEKYRQYGSRVGAAFRVPRAVVSSLVGILGIQAVMINSCEKPTIESFNKVIHPADRWAVEPQKERMGSNIAEKVRSVCQR